MLQHKRKFFKFLFFLYLVKFRLFAVFSILLLGIFLFGCAQDTSLSPELPTAEEAEIDVGLQDTETLDQFGEEVDNLTLDELDGTFE